MTHFSRPAAKDAIKSIADARSDDAFVEKIIDPGAALVRLGGDRELFIELAKLYQDDSVQLFQQLGDAAAHGQLAHIERAAHSLKGLSANFDALDAVQAAGRIEASARAGDLAAATVAIPRLESHLKQIRQALACYIDRYRS